jgi:CheY-like chemotaxis protein
MWSKGLDWLAIFSRLPRGEAGRAERTATDGEEAGDGVEALSLCEKGSRFALLLTEVVIPRMDGVQLAERVCSLPAVRVLYMSGRCELDVVGIHLRKKRPGFVRKPFQIDSLRVTIQALVGPGRARGRTPAPTGQRGDRETPKGKPQPSRPQKSPPPPHQRAAPGPIGIEYHSLRILRIQGDSCEVSFQTCR